MAAEEGIRIVEEELRSVREVARGLNDMLDELEEGKREKVVLASGSRLRGVLISVRRYEELTADG